MSYLITRDFRVKSVHACMHVCSIWETKIFIVSYDLHTTVDSVKRKFVLKQKITCKGCKGQNWKDNCHTWLISCSLLILLRLDGDKEEICMSIVDYVCFKAALASASALCLLVFMKKSWRKLNQLCCVVFICENKSESQSVFLNPKTPKRTKSYNVNTVFRCSVHMLLWCMHSSQTTSAQSFTLPLITCHQWIKVVQSVSFEAKR